MHLPSATRGQSLIEIVFAVAIFTTGVVTIGYLLFDAFASSRYGNEYSQARFLAIEGIEVVQAMRDDSFSRLIPGTYGLALTGGVWTFASTSDSHGQFTRTVAIRETEDDVREVSSTVSWEALGEAERRVEFTTLLTNWMQTGGQREHLEARTSNVAISASSTELSGIELSNIDDESLVLHGMIVEWNSTALLTAISLDGTGIFSASSSPVSSGEYIDTDDYTFNPYSGFRTIDHIAFDDDVGGTNFLVTFFVADGSKKYVFIDP